MDGLYWDIFGSEELITNTIDLPASCVTQLLSSRCNRRERHGRYRGCELLHTSELFRLVGQTAKSDPEETLFTQTEPQEGSSRPKLTWLGIMGKIEPCLSARDIRVEIPDLPEEKEEGESQNLELQSKLQEPRGLIFTDTEHYRNEEDALSSFEIDTWAIDKRPVDDVACSDSSPGDYKTDQLDTSHYFDLPVLGLAPASVILQHKTTLALPYISPQGIPRTVFTASRIRGTAHALGAWTHWVVEPFPAVSKWYDWIQKKRGLIQAVGIVAALLGPWEGTYNWERLFELD